MSHEERQPIFKFWRRAAQLERIERRLLQIANQLENIMATMDQIIDKVAAQNTALKSLNTFVEAIQAEIKALKLSQPDQAKIDKVFADLEANDQAIVDAMEENVPAAPPAATGGTVNPI